MNEWTWLATPAAAAARDVRVHRHTVNEGWREEHESWWFAVLSCLMMMLMVIIIYIYNANDKLQNVITSSLACLTEADKAKRTNDATHDVNDEDGSTPWQIWRRPESNLITASIRPLCQLFATKRLQSPHRVDHEEQHMSEKCNEWSELNEFLPTFSGVITCNCRIVVRRRKRPKILIHARDNSTNIQWLASIAIISDYLHRPLIPHFSHLKNHSLVWVFRGLSWFATATSGQCVWPIIMWWWLSKVFYLVSASIIHFLLPFWLMCPIRGRRDPLSNTHHLHIITLCGEWGTAAAVGCVFFGDNKKLKQNYYHDPQIQPQINLLFLFINSIILKFSLLHNSGWGCDTILGPANTH